MCWMVERSPMKACAEAAVGGERLEGLRTTEGHRTYGGAWGLGGSAKSLLRFLGHLVNHRNSWQCM